MYRAQTPEEDGELIRDIGLSLSRCPSRQCGDICPDSDPGRRMIFAKMQQRIIGAMTKYDKMSCSLIRHCAQPYSSIGMRWSIINDSVNVPEEIVEDYLVCLTI
jgi:hypothetical protein